MASDMTVTFDGKTHEVPAGFTAQEFADSLAASNPKAIGAKLIKDRPRVYTLKPVYYKHG